MSAGAIDPRFDFKFVPELPAHLPIQAAGLAVTEIWVLEYSESSRCFSIQSLRGALDANLRRFLNLGKTGDWVIIGLFNDSESCQRFAEQMQELIGSWKLGSASIDDLLRQISP